MISNKWLLAEDEESDAFIFRMALKKAQLPVELSTFADGQQLVNHLSQEINWRRITAEPGLVVLDLKMPRMNGFDVLVWLRTQPHLRELPALVLSSSMHDEDRRRALELGAREYLVKPIVPGELITILKGMHDRYARDCALPA